MFEPSNVPSRVFVNSPFVGLQLPLKSKTFVISILPVSEDPIGRNVIVTLPVDVNVLFWQAAT